jgi:lipocalin
MKAPIFILIISCLLFSCNKAETRDMRSEVVNELDIERYMGTWYEIARLPNNFENGLTGVTATYELRKNGKIRVTNQGFRDSINGKRSRVRGKAKLPDPERPGWIRVAIFLLVYTDYLVFEIDKENYSYALVGGSSPGYLWILSRTPTMDPNIYAKLIEKARQLGYPVDKLELVVQE